MNGLVFHVVSGQAFFTGIAVVISAIVGTERNQRFARHAAGISIFLGIILVVASSTAIPYWIYAVSLVATIAWIVSRFLNRWKRWAPAVAVGAWMMAAVAEIPFHISPHMKQATSRSITVIGDSVTAGIDGDESSERWPSLLARQHALDVHDISHIGETAGSALKRIRGQNIDSPVVLLEIGGNDILGSTTSSQFATDLDALLEAVCDPNRQVIMFELPLPPLYHEYGRIQRTLARKHHVILIPKRVFLTILAGSESTLDSIHLSQAGHHRMAETVWSIIEPAFPGL